MASGAKLLALYDAILAISQQMREHAQADEWDALVDKELERRQLVAALRTELEIAPSPLNPAEQTQSETTIKAILSLDEETRKLAERWMGELDEKLGSIKTSRRLQNTYLAP